MFRPWEKQELLEITSIRVGRFIMKIISRSGSEKFVFFSLFLMIDSVNLKELKKFSSFQNNFISHSFVLFFFLLLLL